MRLAQVIKAVHYRGWAPRKTTHLAQNSLDNTVKNDKKSPLHISKFSLDNIYLEKCAPLITHTTPQKNKNSPLITHT